MIGIFIILLVVFLQLFLGFLHHRLWKKSSLLADKRTRLVNDVIEGIKVLKYYCWEGPFIERNLDIRKK